MAAARSAHAFSSADVKTSSSSFYSAFYSANGASGYFKDTQTGGNAYFWVQAEMIECVIDAYEWRSNTTDQLVITNLLNGFIAQNGSSWTYNIYNDDISWATIAFARGGLDTGMTNYCNIAKANFDAMYARAYDTKLGGGLYWTTDKGSKNACINGPAAIAAYLLYQIYGDVSYLNKATSLYNWERSVLFNTNSGAIYDNISTNGTLSTWSSTYNQGTFLGAANFLGETNDALLAANYTMTSLTTGGILPEYGIAGNNSGFNAIYLRWLTRFMKNRHLQNLYEPWLQLNAEAAWNLRRSDNLSWCQWLHPSPAGTNFYSWDCISSFEAMHAADPTETNSSMTVPQDAIGNWPLDSTSGTVATDVSGNGNNGVVSAATWNPVGVVKDCLVFNGVSSSVQITNLVCNDFTIAFWARTSQSVAATQWYKGAGLVDGDASGPANDFGVAECNGKLAFGVGNPDTTIISTKAINDGVWHFCVATRQQATGVISLYIDGNLQKTGTANQNTLNASPSLLLGAIASGGGHYNGSLDEVKIYSRALSSDEIIGLYNNLRVAPSASPEYLNASPGNRQIQLAWGGAPAASSYNIKRSLVAGGPYVTFTNITGTSFTDTNVVNYRTYYYVVSAVNALGESLNSAAASASPAAWAAWFAADSISGLPDGAGVSVWNDLTGNGYSAIQPLAANQPTYVAGAINGLPAVRFNSTNNNYLWFYRPVQDDFTIMFVYQSSQGIGAGPGFWTGAGLLSGEVTGTVDDFGTSLTAGGEILAGSGHPDTTIHSRTGLNDGHPHIVTFKRTRSTGGLALYVDGSLMMTSTGGTQSLTSPNQLVLGAQQTLNNFLNGDMAEVQIFNAALSDSDRTGREAALKCKYGLAGGATPLSPTSLVLVPGNRQISLNWMMVPGALGYNLWRSTNSGASFQLLATNIITSSYVDTNALSGQLNYYQVASVDDCGAGGNSAAVSVLLPQPVLQMNVSAGNLTMSWPGWADDWALYMATNLAPPVVWLPVTNAATSNDAAFSVTLPVGPQRQYFRLMSP